MTRNAAHPSQRPLSIPVRHVERSEPIPVETSAPRAPRHVPRPRYRVVVAGGRRLRVREAAA